MLLRILSVFCALFYSTIVFAVEPSPFVRQAEPQIPAYLLRKPEVYNPFKGMFQNWEKRKTKREAANERVNTYIRELIKFYPGSDPAVRPEGRYDRILPPPPAQR